MRRNLKRSETFLSLDHFKKIFGLFNGHCVGLHGWGEPLLNQELFEMIKYAESLGTWTNLTTNGTLIREKLDGILGSGLREIAFGIYDKKLSSRSLPQIEELTKEKRKYGLKQPKTYLDITIYKENLGQILGLARLVPELGVDAAVFHRLFNAYRIEEGVEYISADEEEELFAKIRRLARKLKLEFYLPPKQSPTRSFPCQGVKSCIFVSVEGKITPCCFLPDFYLGNALEEKIEGVISSKRYINFIKDMENHPVCSKCCW